MRGRGTGTRVPMMLALCMAMDLPQGHDDGEVCCCRQQRSGKVDSRRDCLSRGRSARLAAVGVLHVAEEVVFRDEGVDVLGAVVGDALADDAVDGVAVGPAGDLDLVDAGLVEGGEDVVVVTVAGGGLPHPAAEGVLEGLEVAVGARALGVGVGLAGGAAGVGVAAAALGPDLAAAGLFGEEGNAVAGDLEPGVVVLGVLLADGDAGAPAQEVGPRGVDADVDARGFRAGR
mmetsp:Transcript_18381/g.56393  ORF Transcript_18381/g.56393 Transcript_18381/m.56393 type:complete len:231 (+) Transcript_18381:812-1504(+)